MIPGSRPAARGWRRQGTVPSSEALEVLLLLRDQGATPPRDVFALGSQPIHDREHLRHAELLEKSRASRRDIQAVRRFANDHGLAVRRVSAAARTVVLEGRARDMHRAFATKLHVYRRGDDVFRSHEHAIRLPKELTQIVSGVFGLDNRPVSRRPHFAAGAAAAPPPVNANTKLPSAFRGLYSFPDHATGKGQCIGVLEFGGGFERTKLTTYLSRLGVSAPKLVVRQIKPARNLPLNKPGALSPDVEVYMDLEIVASTAPGSTIVVYFGENTSKGWLETVHTAIFDQENRPAVLSISWGMAEQDWDPQTMRALDEAFRLAAALGITVCCSSGDRGVFEAGQPFTVAFPASSPYVLACGGTQLATLPKGTIQESVWNQSRTVGLTSGGGVSRVYDRPPFQSSCKVPTHATTGAPGRAIPDVAANASSLTGFLIFADDTAMSMGGTSAAAPLWAGLVACLNECLNRRIGYLTPLLYTHRGTLHGALRDIVDGNNQMAGRQGYRARRGWDACTGWGSPHGQNLLRWLRRRAEPKR